MIMLRVVVLRNKKSYDFKVYPNRPSSFQNNYKNNSIDWFCIYDDDAEIARYRCQSVANYCFGAYATADTVEHGDTIKEGYFKISAFVLPRNFHGEIHGIIETKDIDGQWIGRDSMQTTDGGFQNGRFLIHDKFSSKYGEDTNSAWSAGCIILSSGDLESFNEILHSYNITRGDVINGEIIEVD